MSFHDFSDMHLARGNLSPRYNPPASGLDSHRELAYYIVTIVFVFLAIVAVTLRIIFAISFAVNSLISVHPGSVGMHLKDVLALPPESLVVTLKTFFAAAFVWITATSLVKLSILHFYIGIFPKPAFRWAAYIIAVLTILFWISYIVTGFVVCRPLNYHWNRRIPGHCANVIAQEIGSASVNLALDLFIVVLPMPVPWSLRMRLKKKILLSGVLSLGLCICAMNLTRVILVITEDAEDFTFSVVYARLFASLEIYVGIITACLPTLGPLVLREKRRPHTSAGVQRQLQQQQSTSQTTLDPQLPDFGGAAPLRKASTLAESELERID
ncbi:hypothetical protein FQN57_003591 [Myotisia sp. PD_48]|nr:hypothetical protein FQN57_003591 [Myotisia sp. PD_48]